MSNATILIVEDDAILAMNLERMLTLQGHTVRGPLATGEDALAFLAEEKVDLVLMDIELAGTMNGITAAEIISRTSDLPIVFLTGFSHDPLLEQAKIAAPYGYLIKPVPERELAATLEMALHRHKLDRQLKESQAALTISEAKYRHLFENSPLGIFRTTLDGRVLAVNAEMVRIFGCDSPEEVLRDYQDLARQYYVDPNRRRDFIAQLRTHGIVQHFECETQKRKGGTIWVSMNAKLTPTAAASGPDDGQAVIDGFAIDITERKRIESVQAFLAQTSVGTADGQFFNQLAEFLAQSLGMDFVCIDYLEGDGLTARTVAVWCDGHFEDNITYALKDTPCGEVVEKAVCCYPAGVCQFFPEDQVLQDLKAESYVGITLFSHTGQPLGLIAVIGRTSIVNRPLAEKTLAMVAVRAAGEMERQQAEAALRESEIQHRTLVAGLPDVVIRFDREGRHLFVSENISEVVALSPEQFLGKTHRELGFPEDLCSCWQAAIERVFASGLPCEGESTFAGKQGLVTHNWRLIPEWDSQKQVQSVLNLSRDITAHRRAEQNYQTLFHEMLDGFALHEIICNQEGKPVDYRFLAVNPAFERMTGLKATDLIGRTVLEVLPQTEPHWIATYGQVALGGKPFHFENYSVDLQKHFEVSAFQPMPNTFACTFIDITERKQAEEALRESEQNFRTLSNSGQALIWTSGTDKLCDYFNTIWLAFTGRTLAQEMGNGWTEGVHPEDMQRCVATYVEAFDRRVAFSMVYRLRRHDGAYRWIIDDGCPRYDSKGEFIGYIGHCLDITEYKQAEEEIHHNESRLRRLVDILQHPAETIQEFLDYVLEQALQLTGSKIGYIYNYYEERQELVLNSWSRDVLPACAVVNPQTCYQLDKTGIWGEAVRQRRALIINDFQSAHPLKKGYPQGHVELLKFVTIPIFKGQRIVSVVGLANKETNYTETDILQISLLMDAVWKVIDNMKFEEEKLNLTSQLLQAQKMEAIGTLAGGIAHDFNNILGAIIGYTEIAADSIPSDSIAVGYLEKVAEASRRAASLVKQILAFSRQAATEDVALQPAIIVKEAIKILRPSLPSTITIKQQIDTATKSILADPSQVHQILMNLCINAYHAMEERGGILEITLKDCELSFEDLENQAGVSPGSFVVLTIGDSGRGISADIRDKIFDPYFTTKEIGKGTGMGLAIVHGIIKRYGGFITCETVLEKGTVFQVYFPAMEQVPTVPGETLVNIQSGKERILFIDDEEILVDLGKTVLERLGYEVTVRTSSLEAWNTFKNQPDRFDIVITDQTMPGVTGSDLALKMLQLRPNLPIILCTGYSSIISEEKAKSMGIKGFALKPLVRKEIALLIRQVLDEQAARSHTREIRQGLHNGQ